MCVRMCEGVRKYVRLETCRCIIYIYMCSLFGLLVFFLTRSEYIECDGV